MLDLFVPFVAFVLNNTDAGRASIKEALAPYTAAMFEISVTRTFCASHQVRFGNGTLEPLHGHNWTVTVVVAAAELDADGFVIDFHRLERRLDAILNPLNNAHLNDAPLLAGANPSAEIVCHSIGQALVVDSPAWLVSVAITEAPGCVATWRPLVPSPV